MEVELENIRRIRAELTRYEVSMALAEFVQKSYKADKPLRGSSLEWHRDEDGNPDGIIVRLDY